MLAPFPDSFALMGREVVHHHLSGRKRRGKNPLDVCLKHLLGSAPRQLGTIPSRGVPCLRSLWGSYRGRAALSRRPALPWAPGQPHPQRGKPNVRGALVHEDEPHGAEALHPLPPGTSFFLVVIAL